MDDRRRSVDHNQPRASSCLLLRVVCYPQTIEKKHQPTTARLSTTQHVPDDVMCTTRYYLAMVPSSERTWNPMQARLPVPTCGMQQQRAAAAAAAAASSSNKKSALRSPLFNERTSVVRCHKPEPNEGRDEKKDTTQNK